MNELKQRLLAAFEAEHKEHLEAIRGPLRDDAGAGRRLAGRALHEVARHAHSLKGAARVVDFRPVEALAHGLEEVFARAEPDGLALSPELARDVGIVLDAIEDWVAAWSEAAEPEAPRSAYAALERITGAPAPAGPEPPQAEPAGRGAAPEEASVGRRTSSTVRVNAESLDRLLASAGEIRSDLLLQQRAMREADEIVLRLEALERAWAGLGRRLDGPVARNGQAGQRARALAEAGELGARVAATASRLKALAGTLSHCARSLRHHVEDLEDGVKATRTVAADAIFAGFRKMVRDLAAAEGKEVEVLVEGLDCQADRLVLQRVKDPVMHLLRNAVSHGIEPPEERARTGKRRSGRVAMRIATDRDRLSIVVEDDGRGVDLARVRARAVAKGLLDPAEADGADPVALGRLVFEPGFSTADSVTEISGRGVGLSVAHQAAVDLQGSIELVPHEGGGTQIELSLPVALVSQRVLLFSGGGAVYAMPGKDIARLCRVARAEIATVEGMPTVRIDGETLPLVAIGQLVAGAGEDGAIEGERVPVMVLRSGRGRLGVAVDRFESVNDFVVKQVDLGGLDQVKWSGMIQLDDGRVCLVLSASALVDAYAATEMRLHVAPLEAAAPRTAPSILIVDDSITTRTLEKSILEARGYRVRVSVDGEDALAQLRAEPVDIVISDIEMPRMNGFQLLQSMKRDRRLADIPVVLVTSRDDPEDRRQGLDLGADAYIVKQRFDQDDLLKTIGRIV